MILFSITFIFLIFFLLNLILSSNTLYSILSLICIFVIFFILLLLLGVDYFPLIFISIYVGALSTLFLFVVMVLNSRTLIKTSNFLFYFFLLFSLFIFFNFYNITLNCDGDLLKVIEQNNTSNQNSIIISGLIILSGVLGYYFLKKKPSPKDPDEDFDFSNNNNNNNNINDVEINPESPNSNLSNHSESSELVKVMGGKLNPELDDMGSLEDSSEDFDFIIINKIKDINIDTEYSINNYDIENFKIYTEYFNYNSEYFKKDSELLNSEPLNYFKDESSDDNSCQDEPAEIDNSIYKNLINFIIDEFSDLYDLILGNNNYSIYNQLNNFIIVEFLDLYDLILGNSRIGFCFNKYPYFVVDVYLGHIRNLLMNLPQVLVSGFLFSRIFILINSGKFTFKLKRDW